MRDAFGGVFMMRLFLVFLFIYVAFAAVSLNYAKAFRLKNAVISFIEEQEIVDISQKGMNNKLAGLDRILQNTDYNKTCDSIGYQRNGEINLNNGLKAYCYNGVVIKEKSSVMVPGTNSTLITYEVITAASWNVGALNKLIFLMPNSSQGGGLKGFWEISGEAQVVKRR